MAAGLGRESSWEGSGRAAAGGPSVRLAPILLLLLVAPLVSTPPAEAKSPLPSACVGVRATVETPQAHKTLNASYPQGCGEPAIDLAWRSNATAAIGDLRFSSRRALDAFVLLELEN